MPGRRIGSARPWRAFWIGVRSVFDLSGRATAADLRALRVERERDRQRRMDAARTTRRPASRYSGPAQDADAIRAAWETVGDDLRKAMGQPPRYR